jgi:uncharacterized protein YsxB (DUF464 family)
MKARIVKQDKKKEFTEISVNINENKYSITAVGHNHPKICAAISFALITLAQALEFQHQDNNIKNLVIDLQPGNSIIEFEDNKKDKSEARIIVNTIVDGLSMLQMANNRKIIMTGNVFGGSADEIHKKQIEQMRTREKAVLEYMSKNNSTAVKREETKKKYEEYKVEHPGHGTDDSVIENGYNELMKEIESSN